MSVLELANQLKAQFGDLLSAPAEFRGEITLQLADPEKLVEVCTHAKQALGFDYLVDISSVDRSTTFLGHRRRLPVLLAPLGG